MSKIIWEIFIKMGVLTVVACFIVLSLMPQHANAQDGVIDCGKPVVTQQGQIQGRKDAKTASCVWKGVPYAAPPLGNLRWKAPEPPLPHEGIYKAYRFGLSCMQDETISSGGESKSFSEDCLFLNIWRPKKPGKFPVMYWIHGGGYREGAGTYDMFNGARLAGERDIVVVTINYRLAAFGFMALPELAEEDPNGSTGDYGLMDAIQGLKWVRDNISGFGGDPDNVTIFGQSAGGNAIYYLLTSRAAQGLFHKAISMSGRSDLNHSIDMAYENGIKFAKSLGCKGKKRLECMRSKTAEELVPVSPNLLVYNVKGGGVRNYANLDGYIIPRSPIVSIREGKYAQVPFMAGTTRDEVKLYAMLFPWVSKIPKRTIGRIMKRLTKPALYEDVMKLYSFRDYDSNAELLFSVANQAWAGNAYEAMEELSPSVPAYLYRFDWDDTRFRRKMGACHGMDIPFVFGALDMKSQIARILTSKDTFRNAKPLSEQMMSYYSNFARTGNPNGPGLPEWPAYNRETRMRINFDIPIKVAPLSETELERYKMFISHQFYGFYRTFDKKN